MPKPIKHNLFRFLSSAIYTEKEYTRIASHKNSSSYIYRDNYDPFTYVGWGSCPLSQLIEDAHTHMVPSIQSNFYNLAEEMFSFSFILILQNKLSPLLYIHAMFYGAHK